MGHHMIPQGHKELLQAILKEMIKLNDPHLDHTFEEIQPDPDPPAKVLGIGES